MPEISNLFDEEEISQVRKDQEDPWVMYLIVRDSLNMSPGKMSAQCSHGATIIYEHYLKLLFENREEDYSEEEKQFEYNLRQWSKHSFRKVTLKANDQEFEKVRQELPCFVVKDAGLTEVEPKSMTVIALAPMRKSQRPDCIKFLTTKFDEDYLKIAKWLESKAADSKESSSIFSGLYYELARQIKDKEYLKKEKKVNLTEKENNIYKLFIDLIQISKPDLFEFAYTYDIELDEFSLILDKLLKLNLISHSVDKYYWFRV